MDVLRGHTARDILVPMREAAELGPESLPATPLADQGGGGWSTGLAALQGSLGNAGLARLLRGPARTRSAGGQLARDVTGNPGDTPGPQGTTHAAPTVADATNHTKPADAPAQTRRVSVRVLAGPDSPIKSETPQKSALYEEQAADADAAAPPMTGYLNVQGIRGSTESPIIDEIADDSLFIDPGPSPDDVQQGGIGDCWELATFIGIVNRDPGKIRSIMTPDGQGGASVTLLHREEVQGLLFAIFGYDGSPNIEYKPAVMQVSNELAFRKSGAAGKPANDRAIRSISGGKPYGYAIRGAQLRAAPAPKESSWWCEVVGDTLEVHRADVYQMARWAPIMEKAAARFSELYGQYGASGQGGMGTGEKRDPGQGYANIAAGAPGQLLTVFYGKEGEVVGGGQSDTAQTSSSPLAPGTGAAAIIKANAPAFARVASLEGRGESGSGGAKVVPVVTAFTGNEDAYVPRLVAAIPIAIADPDYANVAAGARTDVTAVQTACATWSAAPPDPKPMPTPPPTNTKTATFRALIAAAQQATNATRNPSLLTGRSAAISAMVDQLLIIKNMPSDSGTGSRSVYAGHAYSVLSVAILDSSGAPVPFGSTPVADWEKLYGRVDLGRSQVKMQNPHHTNEPNPTGGPVLDGKDEGIFSVDLDRFFRLMSDVTSANVPTSRA